MNDLFFVTIEFSAHEHMSGDPLLILKEHICTLTKIIEFNIIESPTSEIFTQNFKYLGKLLQLHIIQILQEAFHFALHFNS